MGIGLEVAFVCIKCDETVVGFRYQQFIVSIRRISVFDRI